MAYRPQILKPIADLGLLSADFRQFCSDDFEKALVHTFEPGSFHVNSTSVFHGPPQIVLKFGTVVEHG